MVNPGICRKCRECESFDGLVRDEAGKLVQTPSMVCKVAGHSIIADCPVPDGCPYRLEHLLSEEDTRDMVEGWEQENRESGNETNV